MSNIMLEVQKTQSEFLCALCHSLLYVSLDGKDEICSNPSCVCFPCGITFGDPSEDVRQGMEKRKVDLIVRTENTDTALFIRFVYEIRLALVESMLRRGVLPGIEEFFASNELLMLLNSLQQSGKESRTKIFVKIFEDFKEYVAKSNFIEDIQNKRYLVSLKGQAYLLKYLKAVRILQQNYGLTSIRAGKLVTENLFKYDEVDRVARREIKLEGAVNFGDYFSQMFSHIWALKYFLQMYYRTKLQFNYSANTYDIVFLMSLFLSLPTLKNGEIPLATDTQLKDLYDKNANGQRNYNDFAGEYIDSNERIPILVRFGDKILVDKSILLFFIPYLIGLNKNKVPGQTSTGSEQMEAKKQELGIIFENYVREAIRKQGYQVPPNSVTIKYEYDAIGVLEEDKRILLVDAKYRDLSPSAISGVNLIDHELLDEREGLIYEVIRHQERLDYFLEHFQDFKKKIGFKSELMDYEVQAIVVTKYPPLINKYRQVHVLDYDNFVAHLNSSRKSEANSK